MVLKKKGYTTIYILSNMSRPQTEQYKQFLKHKNHFIKKLGKKALFDNQLTIEGKALFGNKYLGTFSQNNIPLNRTGYLIANVDTLGMPGSHWVAIDTTPKTFYIYDSFGRQTTNLLPILEHKLNTKKVKYLDSNPKPEQFGKTTEICGQLCLAWLCIVKEYGVRKALTI
jgi:hypothetical protein